MFFSFMIKIWLFLWIVLSIVLIGFPVIILSFLLSKKLQKFGNTFLNQFSHSRFLRKFKEDIILRWKKTSPQDSGDQHEPSTPQLSEDLIRESLDETSSYTTSSFTKDLDVVKNIVDASLETSESSEEPLLDKESFMKNKKLLEKIVYEALVLRKEWKLDEYEKKLIEWLALDPNDKDLNRFLADYYFSLWLHKKALSLLKKIVELDPKDHKAIWQIGEIYLTSWDFETAELLIEKAILINPANPKYYVSMVELFYNTDRKHDAIQQLEQIVKLRPTNPSYMITLADLYFEVGDPDSAQKYYFRVLEHEPSNEKAKRKLKELVKE